MKYLDYGSLSIYPLERKREVRNGKLMYHLLKDVEVAVALLNNEAAQELGKKALYLSKSVHL